METKNETKIDPKPNPSPVAFANAVPKSVVDAVGRGSVVFYGEYRRGIAVEFSSKGGKVYHQSKCAIETPSGTITVTEFLPDNMDWTKWTEPFPKGTMVMCICRGLEEASGVQVASGKLHAVV